MERVRGSFAVAVALAAVMPFGGAPASSQPVPPDAGRLLQQAVPPPAAPPAAPPLPEQPVPEEVAPAPAPPGGPAFRLNGVRFAGNTVLEDDALAEFARDRIGTEVTLAELERIAERITRAYRERGYFLAQAVVPQQEIVGGVVEFSVIEGNLGQVRIERAEGVPIGEQRLRAYLGRLTPGEPLTERQLERAMLLLSDLPGVVVQSSLEEGEQAATADLVVEVTPGRRVTYEIAADNFGQKSSGEYRLGGGVRVASPFGVGDNLDVRAQLASASRTVFGRIAYERPVGGNGLRAGIGYAALGYELGDEFAVLGAEGFARVLDLSLQQPLVRQRAGSLLGSVGLQRKWVEDRYEAFDFRAHRDLLNVTAGLTFDRRDYWLGGGFVNATVLLTAGEVDVESGRALDLDQEESVGRRTDGHFVKLNYSLSRLQAIVPQWTLFGAVVGQVASRNLDNAERFGIGGPRAVRAYSSGALVADEGVIATAELRYSMNPRMTVSLFYDAGWGRVNRNGIDSSPGSNHRSLRGWGFGFFWGQPGNFQILASLAWRDTPPAPGDAHDRSPRLYVQAVKFF